MFRLLLSKVALAVRFALRMILQLPSQDQLGPRVCRSVNLDNIFLGLLHVMIVIGNVNIVEMDQIVHAANVQMGLCLLYPQQHFNFQIADATLVFGRTLQTQINAKLVMSTVLNA